MGGSEGRRSARILYRPIGGWRTQLLWRAFGVVLLQLFVLCAVQTPNLHALASLHPTFFAIPTFGGALVVLGARCGLLIATSLAMTAASVAVSTTELRIQLGEEFLPLALLPAVGAGLAIWGVRGQSPGTKAECCAVDGGQLALFRASLIVLMGSAVLHKLNVDFLDPSFSCANEHFVTLRRRLPPILILESLVPYLAIVGELSIPVLLVAAPRLGLPVTALMMGYIGHAGATSFTLLVICHSIAFLEEGDGAPLAAAFRRRWPWLIGVLLAMTLASVHLLKRDPRTWANLWVFSLVVVSAFFGFAYLAWTKISDASRAGGERGRSVWTLLRHRIPLRKLLGAEPVVRGVASVLVVAGAINALSPYLGLKDRLSQAMLSNLRADETRWNHLFIPEAIRLFRESPFVELTEAELVGVPEHRVSKYGFGDGHYTPLYLRMMIARTHALGGKVSFTAEFRGERRTTRNAAWDPDFMAWLESLPPGRLFRERLDPGPRQRCIH